MKNLKITSLFLSFCFQFMGQTKDYPQDYFGSPLEIPLILSGTFGELRTNHFHAGIDIKTNGVEGLKVLAAAEGEIARIKVSPWGYGNALYIRHPNGYTTVYAHLQEFAPKVKAYVKSHQYKRKSFDIELYPPKGMFTFEKGEMIAYSGNTGGSGGPHLHFEIRDTKTEETINPLLFGYDIEDHRKPEVFSISVIPMGDKDYVESSKIYLKKDASGNYIATKTIRGYGNLGLSIHTIDRLDKANNANGVFEISFSEDSNEVFGFRAERFFFHETRYLNAHINYEEYLAKGRKTHNCFIQPYDYLGMYTQKSQNGFVKIEPGQVKNLYWKIKDVKGNEITISAKVAGTLNPSEKSESKLRKNGKNALELTKDGFYVSFPKNSFYHDPILDLVTEYNRDSIPTFKIVNEGIPVHKYFEVSLPVPDIYKNLDPKKLCVIRKDHRNRIHYEGGEFKSNKIETKSKYLGSFYIHYDTIAPTLKPLYFKSGQNLVKSRSIRIKVSDNLSGLASYAATIDGKWVLMEYDPKKALLKHTFEGNLEKGDHIFTLEVSDSRGNATSLQVHFFR